jgi:hypothetical protein
MSKAAILQYSALLVAPFMLQLIPGAAGRVPPAGFIGYRDTLPSLQRLAVYCGEALIELEKALL